MENYIDYLDQTWARRILGFVVIIFPLFAIMFLTITKSFKIFTAKQGFYIFLLYVIIPNIMLFACFWIEASTLLVVIPAWYLSITLMIIIISAILRRLGMTS